MIEANSAKNPEHIDKIKNIEFDFILDDGSHIMQNQYNTFINYFKFLKNGGLYIIEDIGVILKKFDKSIRTYLWFKRKIFR